MTRQRYNFITLHEAMDLLGISRSTFDRWRKQKQLPYTKIGKEILIDKIELTQWVRYHSSDMKSREMVSMTKSSAQPPIPSVVTVGYQSGTAHMWTALIMKELGWFEEELAKEAPGRTVHVQWFDAANGPMLLQRLIGGQVQIASMGDYPITLSFSVSQMLPAFQPVLLAFDGKTSGGQGISLVVRKDLPIRHTSEISNLMISTVAQSSACCRLLKLLQTLGGNPHQIVHKEMEECMAGIVQKQIAGSAMWEPYLSLIQYHGAGQLLFQEGFGEDYLTGIVADENWASNHREVTVAYLKAHIRVHHLIRNDPQLASKLINRSKGIPCEVTAQIIDKVRWDAALYGRDLQTLTQLNENNRATDNSAGNRGEVMFRTEYLRQAVMALKLPIPNDGLLDGNWSQDQLY